MRRNFKNWMYEYNTTVFSRRIQEFFKWREKLASCLLTRSCQQKNFHLVTDLGELRFQLQSKSYILASINDVDGVTAWLSIIKQVSSQILINKSCYATHTCMQHYILFSKTCYTKTVTWNFLSSCKHILPCFVISRNVASKQTNKQTGVQKYAYVTNWTELNFIKCNQVIF